MQVFTYAERPDLSERLAAAGGGFKPFMGAGALAEQYWGRLRTDLPHLQLVLYDEDADRVVLLAEELVEEGDEAASARITATRAQIAALAVHGAEVVAAGRPPCPLCGNPLDPEGHICPKLNGHARRQ